MKKRNCSETCKGIIKEIKNHGLEFPQIVVVQYEVNKTLYEIKEALVMKPYEKIKLGFIPIGYKTKSLIEIKTGIKAIVGNEVNVKFNPQNPKEAYLEDNDEMLTWR